MAATPAPRLQGGPAPVFEPPAQVFRPLTPQEAIAKNAQTPFSREKLIPAAPFKIVFANDIDQARALNCLTQAVYYEAGFEPLQGRRAVAQVVLNRLRHPVFPKTICGVVFQGSQLPTGCQFTFTCDGSLARPPEAKAWREAQDVAQAALAGKVERSIGWATHYHTIFVVPYWMPTLTKLSLIGAHIFYRWPAGMGLPGAFVGGYVGGEPAVFGAPAPQSLELAPPALVDVRPAADAEAPVFDVVAPVQPAAAAPGPSGVATHPIGDGAASPARTGSPPAELVLKAPPKVDMTPQWFGSNRSNTTPIGIPAPRP